MQLESTIKRKKPRLVAYTSVLSTLLAVSFLLSMMIGSLALTPQQVLETIIGANRDPIASSVVLGYRVPRILFSIYTGFVLGIAGGVMQILTRNPLSDPYVTGMSSGAALGAAIAFIIPALPLFAVPLLAFVGGMSMLLLAIFVARKAGGGSISFILAGIAVGTIANAVLMIVISTSIETAHGILYWIFGSFSTSTWNELQIALLISLPPLIYIFLTVKDLNILLLGEEHARRPRHKHEEAMVLVTRLFELGRCSVHLVLRGYRIHRSCGTTHGAAICGVGQPFCTAPSRTHRLSSAEYRG